MPTTLSAQGVNLLRKTNEWGVRLRISKRYPTVDHARASQVLSVPADDQTVGLMRLNLAPCMPTHSG